MNELYLNWRRYTDPIQEYCEDVAEQRRLDEIFASPQSMVKHYSPNLAPPSLADTKNFWYLGVLKGIECTPL